MQNVTVATQDSTSTDNVPNALVKATIEDDSWVIVQAGPSLCALPAMAVRTMVMLSRVVNVPKAPSYVRGVVNLRGQVLPLVDLRLRCGMEALSKQNDDLCKVLDQREQDHRNWLAELEKSVAERRKFTLTTDPHKCAFGQWYDHFHADDLILAGLLRKFDEPHKAVHAVGLQVEQHKEGGDFTAASVLIEKTREGALSKLLELFAFTRAHIRGSSREIAIVIEGSEKLFALSVDKVESVERLEEASVSDVPDIMTDACRQLVRGVARRKKGQQMVLLLDVDPIFGDAGDTAAIVASEPRQQETTCL